MPETHQMNTGLPSWARVSSAAATIAAIARRRCLYVPLAVKVSGVNCWIAYTVNRPLSAVRALGSYLAAAQHGIRQLFGRHTCYQVWRLLLLTNSRQTQPSGSL
jgi:hypothetical protein